MKGHARIALYVVLALLFGWFLWPTPYEYSNDGRRLLRRHRITQKVEWRRAGRWINYR